MYYRAAVLDSLFPATQEYNRPPWVSIEQHWLQNQDIKTLMWLPPHRRGDTTQALPATLAMLKLWDISRKLLCSNHPTPLSIPIKALARVIPDFYYKVWNRCGVLHVYTLQNKGKLAMFDQLKESHTLPNTAHHSYLQLSSWWKTNLQNFKSQ
ncbi:Hypothetical predicted protein, partial [Pelobates cultripes]